MDRFWDKVEVGHPLGCWEWTGAKVRGYGRFWTRERQVMAHRHAYEELVGPIPEGLVLDHLCRNTGCVNPDHVEPVTHAENVRRGAAGAVNGARERAKTHCPTGHPYDHGNTYTSRAGQRHCRACSRQRARARRAA